MGFDRLSFPIPDDILQPVYNAGKSRSEKNVSEYHSLIEEFEYHSRRATDAANRLKEYLCANPSKMSTMERSAAQVNSECIRDVQTISKAFSRKPRSIKAYSRGFFTTALDGSITHWQTKSRLKDRTINLNSLAEFAGQSVIAEDMVCTDPDSNEMYAVVVGDGMPVGEVVRVCGETMSAKVVSGSRLVHSRPLSAISCLSDRRTLLTGSFDHTVAIWPDGKTPQPLLPSGHTAAVMSVCADSHRNVVWSGACDRRVLMIDVKTKSAVSVFKLDASVSHTLTHRLHPHLCLAAVQTCTDQLVLLDDRTRDVSGRVFGWPEQHNITRYLQPSWLDNLVFIGTHSPVDGLSGINVFDLRMFSNQQSVSHLIRQGGCRFRGNGLGDKKWLASALLQDTLVAASSDRGLSFFDLG